MYSRIEGKFRLSVFAVAPALGTHVCEIYILNYNIITLIIHINANQHLPTLSPDLTGLLYLF